MRAPIDQQQARAAAASCSELPTRRPDALFAPESGECGTAMDYSWKLRVWLSDRCADTAVARTNPSSDIPLGWELHWEPLGIVWVAVMSVSQTRNGRNVVRAPS